MVSGRGPGYGPKCRRPGLSKRSGFFSLIMGERPEFVSISLSPRNRSVNTVARGLVAQTIFDSSPCKTLCSICRREGLSRALCYH